jgi:putative oxidoreductase
MWYLIKPRFPGFGLWLARLALGLPTLYHGVWNLSAEGAAWWQSASGLPPALRFVIGTAEVLASVALVTGSLARLAAALLVPIFAGAIPQHWAEGFSFKQAGWETVFVYLMLSLAIAVLPGE